MLLDLNATQVAELSGISRNSINVIFEKMRARITEISVQNSPVSGEFEADESCFGARRVRGKRGRGAGSKTIVFGLFKRDGNVYAEIVSDVKSAVLSAIIRGKASIESVIRTDGWGGYDGLADLGFEKHFRVNHSGNEFSKGNGNHINGIESFWAYAKHRLAKFKGVPKENFFFLFERSRIPFQS
jgi:transposase-like protein